MHGTYTLDSIYPSIPLYPPSPVGTVRINERELPRVVGGIQVAGVPT